MKKITSIFAAIILIACMTITASAEVLACTVAAQPAEAVASEQITVPVTISSNNGFTNFGIALDYDREQMQLVSINTNDGDTVYLCGDNVSVNTDWQDENGNTYGYIVMASDTEITSDGCLFTATFNMSDSFSGTAMVTPIIKYMRNNTAVFSIFEEINVTATEGTVTEKENESPTAIPGDFDGNGAVDVMDITATIIAYQNKAELTETQKAAIDTDGDGKVSIIELTAVIIKYQNR